MTLDFDATVPVHGKQEGQFFHGYYDCHCFLPLYVFCGDRLLTAYLRPSNIDASKHAAAILKLLVARLRQMLRLRSRLRCPKAIGRDAALPSFGPATRIWSASSMTAVHQEAADRDDSCETTRLPMRGAFGVLDFG